MSSYDPIVGTGDFPKLNLFGSRPTVEPGVALVVYSDKGDVLALMPGQRLTAGDVAWKNYRGYFKVDIGTHNLEFQTKVPCNKDAFNFEAKLQVTYQVEDPALIVKNKIRDVLIVLKPEIENRIRAISRKYNAEQSENAEQEINELFRKGLRVNGIFANQIISNLELEPAAREHLRTIQNTRNEIARQDAAHELEIAKSKHEFEIKQLKIDFYAPLIKRDQWDLLALQLAEHPDDVATIANMINQQQFEMLKIMLDKDVIEGFQVEDVGKQVLKRLADNLGAISTKALTDSSLKADAEKSAKKKRKKKSSIEDTQNSENTSEENDDE